MKSREGRFLALALALVAAQLGRAFSYSSLDYGAIAALAWGAGVWLAVESRPSPGSPPSRVVVGAGVLVAAVATAALAASPEYRSAFRLVPIASAAGLAIAVSGRDALRRFRVPLAVLLVLPLLHPAPAALRRLIEPCVLTTLASGLLLRAGGVAVRIDGTFLRLQHVNIEVLPVCSGVGMLTQLLALAVLVVALFPTTPRGKIWLAVTSLAVAFSVNFARVAALAVIANRGDMAAFHLWDTGPGAPAFSLAAVALAGVAWWAGLGPARGALRA